MSSNKRPSDQGPGENPARDEKKKIADPSAGPPDEEGFVLEDDSAGFVDDEIFALADDSPASEDADLLDAVAPTVDTDADGFDDELFALADDSPAAEDELLKAVDPTADTQAADEIFALGDAAEFSDHGAMVGADAEIPEIQDDSDLGDLYSIGDDSSGDSPAMEFTLEDSHGLSGDHLEAEARDPIDSPAIQEPSADDLIATDAFGAESVISLDDSGDDSSLQDLLQDAERAAGASEIPADDSDEFMDGQVADSADEANWEDSFGEVEDQSAATTQGSDWQSGEAPNEEMDDFLSNQEVAAPEAHDSLTLGGEWDSLEESSGTSKAEREAAEQLFSLDSGEEDLAASYDDGTDSTSMWAGEDEVQAAESEGTPGLGTDASAAAGVPDAAWLDPHETETATQAPPAASGDWEGQPAEPGSSEFFDLQGVAAPVQADEFCDDDLGDLGDPEEAQNWTPSSGSGLRRFMMIAAAAGLVAAAYFFGPSAWRDYIQPMLGEATEIARVDPPPTVAPPVTPNPVTPPVTDTSETPTTVDTGTTDPEPVVDPTPAPDIVEVVTSDPVVPDPVDPSDPVIDPVNPLDVRIVKTAESQIINSVPSVRIEPAPAGEPTPKPPLELKLFADTIVELPNGHHFRGKIKRIKESKLTLGIEGGEYTFDLAELKVLNAVAPEYRDLSQLPTASVTLLNGQRIRGRLLKEDDAHVVLMFEAGSVSVPRSSVRNVSFTGRVHF